MGLCYKTKTFCKKYRKISNSKNAQILTFSFAALSGIATATGNSPQSGYGSRTTNIGEIKIIINREHKNLHSKLK